MERRRIAAAIPAVFITAIWLALLLPLHPVTVGAEPDYSSAVALHEAFVGQRDFASLVFPYGPWGILFRGYDPRTFALVLAVWAAIITITSIALCRRCTRSSLWLGLLSSGATAALLTSARYDALCYLMVFLLLLEEYEHGARPATVLRAALALSLSILALGKFSIFIAAVVPLGVVTILNLRDRRVPVAALTFAAGIGLFWLAAGQRLSALPDYLRHSVWLSSGWTDAESLFVTGEWIEELTWIVIACVVTWVASRQRQARTVLTTILFSAGLAFFFFTVFKASYVRFDEQHVNFARATLAASLFVVGSAPEKFLPGLSLQRIMKGALALLAVVVVLANSSFFDLRLPSPAEDAKTAAEYRREIERKYPIDATHSVDAVPFRAAAVVRAPRYSPRPVLQSYLAYDERLSRLDAAHLRTSGAELLLFEVAPLDRKLPTLEDPLYWVEILRHYEVAEERGEVLLLRRNDRPRELQTRSLLRTRMSANTSYRIPAGGCLRAFIDVELTPLGRIVSLLYKVPPVTLELTTAQGRSQSRLIRASASAGFILSPLVRSEASLKELMADCSGQRVSSIRILVPETTPALYRPGIGVTIDDLRLESVRSR